jgi:uncharacterized membrane protein
MGFLVLLSIGIVILLIVANINSIKLRNRIDNLEWQFLHLNKFADRLKDLEDKIALLKLNEGVLEKEKPDPEPIELKQKPSVTQSEQAVKPAVQEIKKPASEFEQPKSRTREEWESFIGGKLLNRIGALALIIGVGFFLKYAFDNNWISETVRVIIGGLIGLSCLGFAYRVHKKGFQIFAQGLLGAGISILYLSVYASFNFYELIPQWVAFILMSAVTALSLAIGLYYNSLAVGVLGWAGGFLTPIMLSTGVANEIGLFTYIALLDVGLLAIVFVKREWNIIEPLTLAGTWIMFFAWYFEYYKNSDLTITVFFISVFWILFFGLDFIRLRMKEKVNTLQHIIAGINLFLFFIMLYALVDEDHHVWMGGLTLLLACIYSGAFYLLHKHEIMVNAAAMRYTLSAIALTVIATSIQFEDFTTVILWSIEIALLVWCGVQWKQRYIYFAAVILFAFTVLKFSHTKGAFAYDPIEQFTPVFNERCLTLVVMSLAVGLSAWFLKDTGKESERFSTIFHTSWCIAVFTLFTAETGDFFRLKMIDQNAVTFNYLSYLHILVLTVIWCLISLPLVWISIRNRIMPILISGFSMLALSICFAVVYGLQFKPIIHYDLLFNIRTGLIFLMIAGLYLQCRIIGPYGSAMPWLKIISGTLQIAIVALLLVLLTGETIDYFENQIVAGSIIGDELRQLKNLRQLCLSGIWLLYSVILMTYGFRRLHRSYRIVAFVLFGFTILKIFIYDLSYLETLYRIFSFIGLGVILLAVSYVYQKYKKNIFGTEIDNKKLEEI